VKTCKETSVKLAGIILLLMIVTVLMPSVPVASANPPNVASSSVISHQAAFGPQAFSGKYWFQVGAIIDGAGYGATGGSVEIRVLSPQKPPERGAALAYWIGINLPNDAFIQAGYDLGQDPYPNWFWEYYPPGTASSASVWFGKEGDSVGPNGTWIKFSVAVSSGTTWSAYVDDRAVGSVDLHTTWATDMPYAMAEVAGTTRLDNVLGPVEFRNLSYRDSNGLWHLASSARELCCYGAGSSQPYTYFPYSVFSIPGQNNHWLAGSNLPSQTNVSPFGFGRSLWPWYYVTVEGRPSLNGWYGSGSIIYPPTPAPIQINQNQRQVFQGWSANHGIPQSQIEVSQDLTIKPVYVDQYYVTVTSPYGQVTGSRWYNSGSRAEISVNPTVIPRTDILSSLGVRTVFNGWTGDYSSTQNPASVMVTRPMSIEASWTTDYGLLLPLILLLCGIAIVILIKCEREKPHPFMGG